MRSLFLVGKIENTLCAHVSRLCFDLSSTMPTFQLYSASEISPHRQKESCWVTINDYVYDLTPWIMRQPDKEEIAKEIGMPFYELICGQMLR